MDIRAKVEEIVEKIKNDKDILAKFEKNPASVIEDLIGVDLPDDQVNDLVDAIKAQLTVEKLSSTLGGLVGKMQRSPEESILRFLFLSCVCAMENTLVFAQ